MLKTQILQLCIIISELLAVALNAICLCLEMSSLEKNSLNGVKSPFEHFCTWTVISIVFILAITLCLLFPKKRMCLYLILIIIILQIILLIFSIIWFSFYRSSITNGFSRPFKESSLYLGGIKIQNHFQCCGWLNSSLPIPDSECKYTDPCYGKIYSFFGSQLVQNLIFLSFSFLLHIGSIFIGYFILSRDNVEEEYTHLLHSRKIH